MEPPKGELEHIHYFCGNTEIPADLQEREPQRAALYKATAALVRAYANIADELEAAGYSEADIARIKQQLQSLPQCPRNHPQGQRGKPRPQSLRGRHAAPHRHLHRGRRAAEDFAFRRHGAAGPDREDRHCRCDQPACSKGLKSNKNAVAETIENNVRSKIIKEHLNDPAFYEKMSALLDEIIAARKAKAIEYEEYLKRIAELAKKVEAGQGEDTPGTLNTPGKRALYNNLNQNEELALRIDETVKQVRPDAWRGVEPRSTSSSKRCLAS